MYYFVFIALVILPFFAHKIVRFTECRIQMSIEEADRKKFGKVV